MVFCKKNVNSIPEINWDDFCDGDDAGADGEAKEEPDLDDLEDDEADAFDHEETVELPAVEGPDLSGADLECFELLSQIKAREAADSIGWMELEEGDGAEKLESISDSAAQRLGCSQSARSLPPPMLELCPWSWWRSYSWAAAKGCQDIQDAHFGWRFCQGASGRSGTQEHGAGHCSSLAVLGESADRSR